MKNLTLRYSTIQDIGQRINTIEDKFNEFQKQTNSKINSKHKYTYQGIGKIPQGTTDLLINGIKYFPFSSIVDPTTIEYINIPKTVTSIIGDFKGFTALKCIKIPMQFFHLYQENSEQRFIERFVNTEFYTWSFKLINNGRRAKLTRGDEYNAINPYLYPQPQKIDKPNKMHFDKNVPNGVTFVKIEEDHIINDYHFDNRNIIKGIIFPNSTRSLNRIFLLNSWDALESINMSKKLFEAEGGINKIVYTHIYNWNVVDNKNDTVTLVRKEKEVNNSSDNINLSF